MTDHAEIVRPRNNDEWHNGNPVTKPSRVLVTHTINGPIGTQQPSLDVRVNDAMQALLEGGDASQVADALRFLAECIERKYRKPG